MSNINQLPLWCRDCGASYEAFDDNGVCTECDTPNVLERHSMTLLVPVDDYTLEDAKEGFTSVVDTLIKLGILPDGTVVF